MSNVKFKLREQWLHAALKLIAKHLEHSAEVTVPEAIRLSVGLPGGRGSNKKAIGQCWSPLVSKDKTTEVFISPVIDSPNEVLATLLHEVVHAAVGTKCGHKGAFKRAAIAAGLEGKMTATVAGSALAATIKEWVTKLGDYPHGALDPNAPGAPKKQGTRLLKCQCETCGYTVRTTAKWIVIGTPICPCNGEPMVSDSAEEEDDE